MLRQGQNARCKETEVPERAAVASMTTRIEEIKDGTVFCGAASRRRTALSPRVARRLAGSAADPRASGEFELYLRATRVLLGRKRTILGSSDAAEHRMRDTFNLRHSAYVEEIGRVLLHKVFKSPRGGKAQVA